MVWRLHFFSGLLAGPVILWLALTGIVFAWNPQIESALYHQALTAVSGAPDRPLAQQVRAAKATHPVAGQLPPLVLMVGYIVTGLYLLFAG